MAGSLAMGHVLANQDGPPVLLLDVIRALLGIMAPTVLVRTIFHFLLYSLIIFCISLNCVAFVCSFVYFRCVPKLQ